MKIKREEERTFLMFLCTIVFVQEILPGLKIYGFALKQAIKTTKQTITMLSSLCTKYVHAI